MIAGRDSKTDPKPRDKFLIDGREHLVIDADAEDGWCVFACEGQIITIAGNGYLSYVLSTAEIVSRRDEDIDQ